jgi:hypothetical protein
MILSKQEQDMFFQNYFALLYYASVYEGILPEGSSLKDFYNTSLAQKAASRDILFKDKSVIKNFKQDNRHFFGNILSLDFVNNVQKGLYGRFAFIKENKMAAIFYHLDSKKFYEVGAITEPLSKIAPGYPVVIETAIFNFNDKIICDGMINQNVLLGKNVAEGFLTEYNDSIKKGQVLKKL